MSGIDAEIAHDDDQVRAEAHKFIDDAESFVVVSQEKDGTVRRIRNTSDAGAIALLGALEYQAHRLRLWLDEQHYNDLKEGRE